MYYDIFHKSYLKLNTCIEISIVILGIQTYTNNEYYGIKNNILDIALADLSLQNLTW